MASYIDRATGAAQNQDFVKQVQVAMLVGALAVADEPQGVLSAAAYGKRQALAQQVLGNAGSLPYAGRYAWVVAAALTAQPSDANIQQVVTDNWSRLAGVTALDI